MWKQHHSSGLVKSHPEAIQQHVYGDARYAFLFCTNIHLIPAEHSSRAYSRAQCLSVRDSNFREFVSKQQIAFPWWLGQGERKAWWWRRRRMLGASDAVATGGIEWRKGGVSECERMCVASCVDLWCYGFAVADAPHGFGSVVLLGNVTAAACAFMWARAILCRRRLSTKIILLTCFRLCVLVYVEHVCVLLCVAYLFCARAQQLWRMLLPEQRTANGGGRQRLDGYGAVFVPARRVSMPITSSGRAHACVRAPWPWHKTYYKHTIKRHVNAQARACASHIICTCFVEYVCTNKPVKTHSATKTSNEWIWCFNDMFGSNGWVLLGFGFWCGAFVRTRLLNCMFIMRIFVVLLVTKCGAFSYSNMHNARTPNSTTTECTTLYAMSMCIFIWLTALTPKAPNPHITSHQRATRLLSLEHPPNTDYDAFFISCANTLRCLPLQRERERVCLFWSVCNNKIQVLLRTHFCTMRTLTSSHIVYMVMCSLPLHTDAQCARKSVARARRAGAGGLVNVLKWRDCMQPSCNLCATSSRWRWWDCRKMMGFME